MSRFRLTAALAPFTAALVLVPLCTQAQPAGWNDPFPPHKIMDNFYYVGTSQLSSFLLTTDDGLILISSDYESSVPVIQAAVAELGFDFKDIKILISGHGHPDHVEGDALVKELTGAEVVVSRLDAPYNESVVTPSGKHLPIDRLVDDGDTVTLGDVTLTAHLLPGHTKGCMAWSLPLQEAGKTYYGFIECSLNGQFLQYVDNTDYPGIVEDMRGSYRKAREFPVEVFVSSHGIFYDLEGKYAKLQARGPNDPNPFIDPEGYQAHVAEYEGTFEAALARQQAEAADK
ncbi:MAG TPA: MBL fold metallo-hydrolase [Hyphomicrobiales bacterium]|nr:MBL fold metallo-hydrolase [Hyphomicrobiales bacterium]